MKKDKKIIIGIIFIIMFLIVCVFAQKYNYEKAINTYVLMNDELNKRIEDKQHQIDELSDQVAILDNLIVGLNNSLEELSNANGYKVFATNYYKGDGSSTAVTGSGLKVSDFKVNKYGMYTWFDQESSKDYLVVAAATWEGINSKEPVLAAINDLPSGYHIYHYGDCFKLWLNIDGGQIFDAIVLDTCGKSMRIVEGEKYQRIDVFIDGSNIFGKVMGFVYEGED